MKSYIIIAILMVAMILVCGCSSTNTPIGAGNENKNNCYSDTGVISEKTIQVAGTGTSGYVWRFYFVTIKYTMYEVTATEYGNTHIGDMVTVTHCLDGGDRYR